MPPDPPSAEDLGSSGRAGTLYSPPYAPPALPHFPVAPVSREAADASSPPMLKHWREVKAQHPETILFYRVGDFYEMFHEDAQLAARVLDITLTSRGDGVPLAGVPVKAAAEYLRQLIGAGHRVAICEQVEDPKLAKGLVRREVVETVTPGAMLQEGWLAGGKNNFLVAVARDDQRVGLAAIDLSTGEFLLETLDEAGLAEALGRLGPAEVVLAGDTALPAGDDGAPHGARALGVRSRPRARGAGPAVLAGHARRPRRGPRGRPGDRRGRRAAPLPDRAAAVGAAAPRAAVRPPERRVPLARRDDPPQPRAGRAAPGRCPRLHAARDDRRHRHADGRPPAPAVAALAAPRSGGHRLPARRGRGDGTGRARPRAASRGARRRAGRRAAGRPGRGGPGHAARARRAPRLVPPPARCVRGPERARGVDSAGRRPRGRAGRRGGRARSAGRPRLGARPRPRAAAAGAARRWRRDPGGLRRRARRAPHAPRRRPPVHRLAAAAGARADRDHVAQGGLQQGLRVLPRDHQRALPRGCRPTTSGGRRWRRPSAT